VRTIRRPLIGVRPKDLATWFDEHGLATVLLSEYLASHAPSSAILLPIDPESSQTYENHILAVDNGYDNRPDAWGYRRLRVRLA
jgi:hypothetical protein